MGALLLTGWTMLAEACLTCNIPLMRKNDVTKCVLCSPKNKPVKKTQHNYPR